MDKNHPLTGGLEPRGPPPLATPMTTIHYTKVI